MTILGHIRDDRALPLLLEALDDDSPAVRKSAAISLGLFFRAITAVPALIGTLDDADPEVGRQAALALGYIRSAEAVAPLTVFYERGDSKSKIAALHAFGSLCDTRTLPLVRAALNHKARVVRKAAKFALSQYDFKRRETLRGTR